MRSKPTTSRPAPPTPENQVVTLPETGFVRLSVVLALIPVGKSTWWAGVKSGRFPRPFRLGPHTTAWTVEDVRRLIEELRTE